MANKLVAVRPADLNPDTINWYNIGSLLVNTVTGDLYMVIDKDGKKTAQLVGGAGRYEMAHHISLSHVIQDYSPVKFDYSTVWYNTSMLYVEPKDAQEAYITVRAELKPGVFGWKTILPISHADQVIIRKKPDGKPYTLKNFIDDMKRTLIAPPTDVNEAERGEIYIKTEDNTLWWKTGPNPEDQYMLGDANPFLIEKLKKQIHLLQEHPVNWDPDSLWLKDGGDANIVDAMSVTVQKSDNDFSGGFKWKPGSKLGVVLSSFDKVATIDLNNTQNLGFILGNFDLNSSTNKYYLELHIKDPEEKMQLLFFNSSPDLTMGGFGDQLDQSSMLFDTKKRRAAAVDYPKDFKWNNKTIYIMVDRPAKKLHLGFVNDDGTLNPVHQNVTYLTSFLGIGSGFSDTANSKVVVSIRSYKVNKIPLGYKAINNILPEETAFENIAPITNAQSVYIDKNTTLGNLHAGAGRLITTPRDFANKDDALPGEAMVDYPDELLWVKKPDGSLFKIGGGNDDIFLEHINSSLLVIHEGLEGMRRDDNNLSKMYISEKEDIPYGYHKDRGEILTGTMGVIDNSPDGNKKYKLYIPYTNTNFVPHTWEDMNTGVEKTTSTKVYLDMIQGVLKNNLRTKFVYRSYLELFTAEDIVNRFNTASLFVLELKNNNVRFSKDAIYLQSIKTKGSNKLSTMPDLTKIYEFFDVPENGTITMYKDDKNKIYTELYAETGNRYIGSWTTDNKFRWDKYVIEKNGAINTSASITTTEKIKGLSFESDTNIKGANFSFNSNDSFINTFDEANDDYKKLFRYTLSDGKTDVVAGDEKTNKTLGLASINRPTWDVWDVASQQVIKYPLALYLEIESTWRYKGELNTDSTLIDLNTLKEDESIGYYLLSGDSNTSFNYPLDASSGFLHVMKKGNYIIQSFNSYDKVTKKTSTFTRTYNSDTNAWNPWAKTVSEDDIDGKYDKIGGPISGNVYAMENMIVEKNFSINKGDIKISEGKIIDNTEKNLLSFRVEGVNKYVEWGDKTHKTHNLFSTAVPRWAVEEVNPDTNQKEIKFYNFALEKDLDRHIGNTYNKTQIDNMLQNIDLSPIERELKKKMSKEGDTGEGDYTFSKGIVKADYVDLKTGKFTIPLIDNNSSILGSFDNLKNTIKSLGGIESTKNRVVNNLSNIVATYNTPTITNIGTSSFNIGIAEPASNQEYYVSNMIFTGDNLGNLYYGFVKNKDFSTYAPEKILKTSNISDILSETNAEKVLSANQGRILHELAASKSVGTIATRLTQNTFNLEKFKSLIPGNYAVQQEADLLKLKLDKEKIAINGALVVLTENNSSNKTYVYLPYGAEDEKSNTIAFMNLDKNNPNSAKWIYLRDYSFMLTREELNRKIREVLDTCLGYIVANEYSYTGNSSNNTMPYRLVHTHNHNGNNVTDFTSPLYFYTNISLDSNGLDSEDSLVMIKLDGYSFADSTPINIVMSVRLKGKSNMTISPNESDVTYMSPGSVTVSPVIKNRTLCFLVQNDRGTQDLTFDTHIRISKVNNLNFNPKVTGFSYGEGQIVNSNVVNKLERQGGLFSNV